ncbi:FecR family protein [Chitinophaga alhagiae]|uniref:FecR family protein n=1 Tax=Chitinophaga alhagiae TaxID=2203219 RepID=UPI000E5BFA3E|nr:FecR family protein [Chitinophaga alhagiae]
MPDEQLDKRLQELEAKWLNNTITPEEAKEYADWYARHQQDAVHIPEEFAAGEPEHAQRMLHEIRRRTGLVPRRARVRHLAVRWAAAAAVLLLVAAGGYRLLQQKQPAPTAVLQPAPVNDREPGRKGAVLTLADGSEVLLDSLKDGHIATQGATSVLMQQGSLAYNAAGHTAAPVSYNTITTPPARMFQLLLPDGTKVWLNAASTCRFPVAFTGKERMVEVTGEAYFEVAHDAQHPFTVKVNDAHVRVLGTHFNVMAYPDEKEIKTTLVEGAVQFTRASRSVLLKPGQQSAAGSGGPNAPKTVEVEQVVAWKNGYFNFKGAPLQEIMRQVARWYDVEVTYEGKGGNDLFIAEILRNSRMSDVLKALELTGKVRFRLNGRVLTVQYL